MVYTTICIKTHLQAIGPESKSWPLKNHKEGVNKQKLTNEKSSASQGVVVPAFRRVGRVRETEEV